MIKLHYFLNGNSATLHFPRPQNSREKRNYSVVFSNKFNSLLINAQNVKESIFKLNSNYLSYKFCNLWYHRIRPFGEQKTILRNTIRHKIHFFRKVKNRHREVRLLGVYDANCTRCFTPLINVRYCCCCCAAAVVIVQYIVCGNERDSALAAVSDISPAESRASSSSSVLRFDVRDDDDDSSPSSVRCCSADDKSRWWWWCGCDTECRVFCQRSCIVWLIKFSKSSSFIELMRSISSLVILILWCGWLLLLLFVTHVLRLPRFRWQSDSPPYIQSAHEGKDQTETYQ